MIVENEVYRHDGYSIAIKQIEDKVGELDCDTYIVHLKYKYDFEKSYIDSYEVVEHCYDRNTWFNDWCEGQTDVVVLGILAFNEIPPTVFHYITER